MRIQRSLRCTVIAFVTACSAPATTGPAIVDPIPMTEDKPTASPYDGVLAAYEKVRFQLADDAGAGLAARELAAQAKTAGLAELAASADTLAQAPSLDQARDAFGAVSKQVVALIATNPDLARGRHVFECPMVKGYNKWVQVSDDMANPYMGKAMLACGGESTWK